MLSPAADAASAAPVDGIDEEEDVVTFNSPCSPLLDEEESWPNLTFRVESPNEQAEAVDADKEDRIAGGWGVRASGFPPSPPLPA